MLFQSLRRNALPCFALSFPPPLPPSLSILLQKAPFPGLGRATLAALPLSYTLGVHGEQLSLTLQRGLGVNQG